MCFNFYQDQTRQLFVPLDFLIGPWGSIPEVKALKVVFKFIQLLKQVLYEVAQDRTRCTSKGQEMDCSNKMIVMFFAEPREKMPPDLVELCDRLLDHARKVALELFA